MKKMIYLCSRMFVASALLAGCGGVSINESSDAFSAAREGELYPTIYGCEDDAESINVPLMPERLLEGADCKEGVVWLKKPKVNLDDGGDWDELSTTCLKDSLGFRTECATTKKNRKTGAICTRFSDGEEVCSY